MGRTVLAWSPRGRSRSQVAGGCCGARPPTCGSAAASVATSPGWPPSAISTSTATTTSGAGRSPTSTGSGGRSGTTSPSSRPRRSPPRWPTPPCRAPAGSRASSSTTPPTPCAPSPTGRRSSACPRSRPRVELSMAELREQVARCRAGLVRQGVGRGDRVAAYLPNIPETVVALLATASLGAIWSSCAPEFGTRSVVDRWQQIEPVVLLAVDGYRYGAKAIDRRDEVAAIRAALPSLRATVTVPYLADGEAARHEGSLTWAELLADAPSEVGGPPASRASPCRSTTRSTSCSRRAPPGCPSRSCTATAASRSSTTRCWRCTTTSGRATASSGSRRRAG